MESTAGASTSSSSSSDATGSHPFPWLNRRPTAPLPIRLIILPLVKTLPGRVTYSLFVAGMTLLALAFRFLLGPRKFLKARPASDHLALKLTDPALGQHLYLKANGITLHAVSLGDEASPLMLFLHGFPEFWYAWRHQMAEFSKKGFRCVAIDMRGYGDSDKPKGLQQYVLQTLAADVDGVIKALGHKKAAAVVAHDWGAIVAYTFAAQYPQSLEKLVITNGPHPVVFKKQILLYPQVIKSSYVFFFQVPFLPELAISQSGFAIMNRVFKAADKNTQLLLKEEIELYKYSLSKPGAVTAAINYYRCLGRSSLQWIKKITVPTLVVWGMDDAFLSPWSNTDLDKVVEKLTFKTIKNCSHWTPVDKPAELNQFIEDFLKAK